MQELNDFELENICSGKRPVVVLPNLNPTLRKINNAVDAHRDAARSINDYLRRQN